MKLVALCALFVSLASAKRVVISTPDAPGAIGPYSQGIMSVGSETSTLYAAGQIGLDPATGKLVDGGIVAETARAMANIEAIVSAANMTMADITECTVLMLDIDDYSDINSVYAEYFGTRASCV